MNEDRLEILEGRVSSLEATMRAFETRFPSVARAAAVAAPPIQQSPPRPPSFELPQAPLPPVSEADAEYQIGAQWLPRIGGTMMVLGIAYLVKLAVDHGWITPMMLFAGAILLCLGLIGLGQWLRNEKEDFGQILTGIGSCGMFLTFAGGHVYQNLYSGETLVALFVSWSLANLAYGWWRESRSFLAIGLFGGLIAAWMPMQKNAGYLSIGLHALILLPTLLIAAKNRWSMLALAAWVAGSMSLGPICFGTSYPWLIRIATFEGFAIISATAMVFSSRKSAFDTTYLPAFMVGFATLISFFSHAGFDGMWNVLSVAGICAGMAFAFRTEKSVSESFGYLALGLATVVAPFGLSWINAMYTFAMLSGIASIAAISRKQDSWAFLGITQLIASVSLYLYLLAEQKFATSEVELMALVALTIASILAGATARRNEADPRWGLAIMAVGITISRAAMVLSGEIFLSRPSLMPLTIAWTGYAAVLLVIGFLADFKTFRYGAISVILITVAKILAIDLMTAAPEIRVAALIGVGAALLAGGYWYIRRKSTFAKP